MSTLDHRWCDNCGKNVAVERPKINHLLHFILFWVTCGLWGWVWLFLVATNQTWRCRTCGMRSSGKLSDYALPAIGFVVLLGLLTVPFIFGAAIMASLAQEAQKGRQAAKANQAAEQPKVEVAPVPVIQPAVPVAVPFKPVDNPIEAPAPKRPVVDPLPVGDPESADKAPVVEDPPVKARDEKREKEATSKLTSAKALVDKNKSAAVRRLKEIVDKYAGTEAAKEARAELGKLE